MGHESYEQMLERLVEVRDAVYRDEVDRIQARFENLESTMQALLEKLRDTE